MLNEQIKKLRVAENLSQVELAKKLNVSKQCVCNWENDNIQPSVEMLIKLAAFFNVTTDSLLGLDERAMMDVTGLTEEQTAHITQIVRDFKQTNVK